MSSLTLPHGIPAPLGAPGLQIAVTANNSLAYIEIDVSGLGVYSTLTLTRLNTVTGTITTVRSADHIATNGAGILAFFDYEAPLNVAVVYTATTNALSSVVSDPVTITVADNVYWLKNVSQEGLSTRVLVGHVTVKRPGRILSTNQVLNRQNPVLVTDVRGGRQGSMSLLSFASGDSDDINRVMAPGNVLLFQAPASARFPDMYFMAADLEEVWEGVASDETHTFSFDYTEVDSPATSLTSLGFNTYLQVTNFGTYANLVAKRASYLTVLNSPWTTADN